MLNWLSGWLRDIIAIILLAAIVDLLLPNKTMQRYARLVVGLIVLLTILSPLIRLFQGDFNQKVEDGMAAWERASASSSIEMPTLEDIEKDAQRLSSERQRQAAALAERQIAAAMAKELDGRLGVQGTATIVRLSDDAEAIESVIVTINQRDQRDQSADSPQQDAEDVQPVQPVDIAVSVQRGQETVDSATEAGQAEDGEQAPTDEQKALVEQTLRQGWGVPPARIEIRAREA